MQIELYCIVSTHLYSASCSAHQSEALPVPDTQREESLELQTVQTDYSILLQESHFNRQAATQDAEWPESR